MGLFDRFRGKGGASGELPLSTGKQEAGISGDASLATGDVSRGSSA